MQMSTTTEAEQYLKQNLIHAESLLFPDQIPTANDVSIQASREGSGLTAWNFILLPNGILNHRVIAWLTSNGYIFVTKPNGPEIQDWLAQATKNNDFKTASMKSFEYLNTETLPTSIELDTTQHPARQPLSVDIERPCPICALRFKASQRYPKMVCADCMQRTVDEHGRDVEFFGDSKAFYKEDGSFYLKPDGSFDDKCFIGSVQCVAQDGYMGGVVVSVI